MKKYLFGMIVSLCSFVAHIGIYPTSWFNLYQPEVPEELIW